MAKAKSSPEPVLNATAELSKSLDALAVGLYEKTTALPKAFELIDQAMNGALAAVLALGDFKAKAGSCITLPGNKHIKRLLVVGLGKQDASAAAGIDAVRWATSAAAKATRGVKGETLALALPIQTTEALGQAIAEGAIMGTFTYKEFKPGKGEEPAGPLSVYVLETDAAARKALATGLANGSIIGRAANLTRTLSCMPPNIINPTTLCEHARALARANGLKVRIIEAPEAARLGMGGLVAVGQGSLTPPAMIIIEHNPGKKGPTYAIVGKAVTFDTGGISIKPAADMDAMKYDKCGGMAVMGVMQAVAQLKVPHHIVGIIPAAENAVGAGAYRPGDILRLYNDKTVEITNTDAEGRLILADAVAYAADKFSPDVMIDMATLTGGCVVALGHIYAGLFSSDDALAASLFDAGQKSGEWLWRLPLHEKYRSMLDGHHADLINSAGREASPITGASFIQHFVPDKIKWAHLDIAGTAMPKRDDRYIGKGASGFGVRVVLEYLRSM